MKTAQKNRNSGYARNPFAGLSIFLENARRFAKNAAKQL